MSAYYQVLKSDLFTADEREFFERELFDSFEEDLRIMDEKIIELGLDSDLLFDQNNDLKGENKMTTLKYGMVVSVEFNYSEVVGTVTEISGNSDAFYIVDEKGIEYKFYTDIHQVTIINEKVFHGMKNVEIINESDYQYFDSAYKVSIYNYDEKWFGVYASCEQSALDCVVDYLESQGKIGMFYTLEEVIECEKDGYVDMFITAGNHCHNLDAEHVQIQQVK